MTTSDVISLARQIELLLNHVPVSQTQPLTVADVAKATGLTHQTLMNLLHGRIENPRLLTLRALCVFYGISLDYFDVPTEAQCRHYLSEQQLKEAPPIIQQIQGEAYRLTERGQHNILSSLEWMSAASSH